MEGRDIAGIPQQVGPAPTFKWATGAHRAAKKMVRRSMGPVSIWWKCDHRRSIDLHSLSNIHSFCSCAFCMSGRSSSDFAWNIALIGTQRLGGTWSRVPYVQNDPAGSIKWEQWPHPDSSWLCSNWCIHQKDTVNAKKHVRCGESYHTKDLWLTNNSEPTTIHWFCDLNGFNSALANNTWEENSRSLHCAMLLIYWLWLDYLPFIGKWYSNRTWDGNWSSHPRISYTRLGDYTSRFKAWHAANMLWDRPDSHVKSRYLGRWRVFRFWALSPNPRCIELTECHVEPCRIDRF